MADNFGSCSLEGRFLDQLLELSLVETQAFDLLSQALLLLAQSVDFELELLAELEFSVHCVLLSLGIRAVFALTLAPLVSLVLTLEHRQEVVLNDK